MCSGAINACCSVGGLYAIVPASTSKNFWVLRFFPSASICSSSLCDPTTATFRSPSQPAEEPSSSFLLGLLFLRSTADYLKRATRESDSALLAHCPRFRKNRIGPNPTQRGTRRPTAAIWYTRGLGRKRDPPRRLRRSPIWTRRYCQDARPQTRERGAKPPTKSQLPASSHTADSLGIATPRRRQPAKRQGPMRRHTSTP